MKKNNSLIAVTLSLVLLLALLIVFVPAFKETVFNVQEKTYIMMTSSYLINGWIVLFLTLFSSIGVGFVLYKIYYIKPKRSIYAHHTIQEIKGAVWKWRWNENNIEQLWCFCPTCNDELSYDTDELMQVTTFSCEQCKKDIARFSFSHISAVLVFVKNEIRRILTRDKITKKS
ncbi:MAG: hypothetical protein WC141_03780 [Arcobacteraceae bacterium]